MRANLEMKFSDFDLREADSSTSSRILEAVDSLNSFVVRTFNSPVRFMLPLITSLPVFTSRGSDSPVRAYVFSEDSPETIIPSIGTRSPGWVIIVSPVFTSIGSILTIAPSFSTLA